MSKPRTKLMLKRAHELATAMSADVIELLNLEREKWRADEQRIFAEFLMLETWRQITMGCVAMGADVPGMLDDFQAAVRTQEAASREYAKANQIVRVTQ